MTPKIVTASVGCALAAAAIPAAAQPATPARVSAMTDQTTKVGMRQVHCLRAGSGATTIVLLPGIAPWDTADLIATIAASLR